MLDTIIPTQIAAAPTARVFFAPEAKQLNKSFKVSLFLGFNIPTTTHDIIAYMAAKSGVFPDKIKYTKIIRGVNESQFSFNT